MKCKHCGEPIETYWHMWVHTRTHKLRCQVTIAEPKDTQ